MRLVFAVLAALLTGMAPAGVLAQQLPIQYLTQQDGLGNLSVNALVQDATGYLWMATENGVFRYNGAEFRRYAQKDGLADTQTIALILDRKQRLWVGTREQLYVQINGRFQALVFEGRGPSPDASQSLALAPDGSVIVQSGLELLRITENDGRFDVRRLFSAEEVRRRPALRDITTFLVEADGRLWMNCGAALCVRDSRGFTEFGTSAGVPADEWQNLLRTSDGALWARGKRHVIVLKPGAQQFIDRTPPGEVMRKATMGTSLVEDDDHRVLVSIDSGLARWRGERWELFGPGNGLKIGSGVIAMLVDRDQGLWLGTGGHGLARWMGYDNWENWGTGQGLPDDKVFAVRRDGVGHLRIATRSGLVMLTSPEATRAVPVPGYRAEQWNSMVTDLQGQLWTSSYVGSLTREDVRSGKVTEVAKLPMIFQLLADREGRLWISTGDGLYVIDDTRSPGKPHLAPGLPKGSGLVDGITRRSCQSADGTLWFLRPRMLWRLRGMQWDSFDLGYEVGREYDAMACAADGSVWLGQGSSLWKTRVGASGLVREAIQSPLLRERAIQALHEDRHGWLWISTDVGLVVWNRRQWRQFDSSDGLVWNDLNSRQLFEEADGTMWITSTNGVSHVTRPERLFAPTPLSAIIEATERDGQTLQLRDGDRLPWSTSALNLRMASLSYQHRDALQFRYRMAGLEQEWTTTSVPQLRYAALQPGSYRLQYAVSNLNTQSESEVRELRFTVVPPWWLSTWFFTLCGVLGAATLLLLYRHRVRGLQQRNARMEQLVRERTSDLEARTRELELSQEALRERALRDGLTKAWNRVAMLEMMEQAMQKSQRDGKGFLLCLLDLDHFKRINDTHGHLAGDAVLRDLVRRLNGCVRPYDLVGRYGGEEFLVLLPDLTQANGAARVEAMRMAVASTPFDIGDQGTLAVTSSFGVVEFDPAQPVAGLELVRRADLALYRAKELGRNRIEFVGPDGDAMK
ncbi:diguanylate cyclase (GGDEF)-like protein [Duganella sp. SG902]|uniref:ligand-binding sensor domain-containing diguanylate cyclase n=1 Tax=Duganella sp. SG902 TaxID=2587016 RepID=UPI00159E941A|nr:diguanylate cyclase [Duganella sp. SG902]NVM80196.1 diguanylate cyclase (GGDEF)-like protein [Duganella sp. SG902]